MTRPVKELKRFAQVHFNMGEAKTVELTLTREDLRFYGIENKWIVEPGNFTLMVGSNSKEVLKKDFMLLR